LTAKGATGDQENSAPMTMQKIGSDIGSSRSTIGSQAVSRMTTPSSVRIMM